MRLHGAFFCVSEETNMALTGRTHQRGHPLAPGDYHLVGDVWTINLENQVLLTQRHPSKPNGLMWECTGGAIQAGENSLCGAIRELREETGLRVSPEQLSLMHTVRLKDRFVDTYIVRLDFVLSQIVLDEKETIQAILVDWDELLTLWAAGKLCPKSRFPLYKNEIASFLNYVT